MPAVLFVTVFLIALGTLPASAGQRSPVADAPSPAQLRRVHEAIVASVRERMGEEAAVTVSELSLTGEPVFEFLQAVPEPDARTGERIAFRLLGSDGNGAPPRVAGTAMAHVRVAVEHVRTRTPGTRGRSLDAADLEPVHGAVDGVPLRRLPRVSEVNGARLLITMAPGEVVTRSAVTARPAVKSGQVVRAVARIDGLEMTTSLVAVQDGAPGAVIRVVNKESRRELRARVVEPGVVEVIP